MGNEGRSGGPQGSKSTRSSEEPFFCSVDYDLGDLASEMNRQFDGVRVVGCTTAGEVGPAGYRDRSLVGASFPAGEFTATTGRLDELRHFEFTQASDLVHDLRHRLEQVAAQADSTNTFALLLIDGLCLREEPVTHALQAALGDVPLVGGSAGDGLSFGVTHVFSEGEFRSDCAALTLVTTPVPFRTFKAQHFVPTEDRVVVTSADAEHRIIKQINGLPAAKEYAKLVAKSGGSLDPLSFASKPMVVMLAGTSYVRSIQRANPDGSLTLYCAIEEGVVLRVARGVDLVENLQQTFDRITADTAAPRRSSARTASCANLRSFSVDSPAASRRSSATTTSWGSTAMANSLKGLMSTRRSPALPSPSRRTRDLARRPLTDSDGGAEVRRLNEVIRALMDRVERSTSAQQSAFGAFETTIMLENQVRRRTTELEAALGDNERITRALRESEAKFHALVSQSLVGISLIEDGRIVYTNAKFAEIFGYDEQETQALQPVNLAALHDRPLVAENIGSVSLR